MERVLEELTIDGQQVFLEHLDVPLSEVHLDEDNPRIRYRLALEKKDGKTLDEVILRMPEVSKLKKDIYANGGLRERVILKKNAKGYLVPEGNCRTVCYRALAKQYPDDPRWNAIPARILPDDIAPRKVAVLLSDLHVAGKIQWKAHEKAGQVYRMHRDLGMTFEEISTYLRQSKTTTKRFYDAYAFMTDRFFTVDGGKFAKMGEGKWSFFDELFRSKELREHLAKNNEFGDDFCRWVGNENLPDGADVRDLPAILKNPEAYKRLKQGAPFKEVRKVVEDGNPEHGSEFFKLLAKVRENLTNAAQVKEILKIRTDKAARERLLGTYEALVDFMRLADVEVPEVK